MPRFQITASATAIVRASTYVEADTRKAAEVAGQEFFQSGDAEWKYDGVVDDTVEIERAVRA